MAGALSRPRHGFESRGIAPDHFYSYERSLIGSVIGALFSFSLEPTLQCAHRQIMLLTKFTPPKPTGFEFRHQAFDLLAASPLPNANHSDFRHADVHQKHAPSARWIALTGTY